MSKRKNMLLMLAKGGSSQDVVAAACQASKRDVSRCAKIVEANGLTPEAIEAMTAAEIDERYFPRDGRKKSDAYLQPDLGALVERKKRNRKLPVKYMWQQYCASAAQEGKLAYSYQTFCELFADEAERRDATRHFTHEPGEKAYIDWAGLTGRLVDAVTGEAVAVYVLVVCLAFSNEFWAEGFLDMKQESFQRGQSHAFERFCGVPRLLVPDNCGTATNRTKNPNETILNREYKRFAEFYGTAILPARVRKPRDKSLAEATVDLVEQWVIAPANEMGMSSVTEFNEFCATQVAMLNARPFTGKEGSRDSVYQEEEYEHMLPLPERPYETCEWRQSTVTPDYHITINYMHYSVPFRLIGEKVDVKMTDSTVTIMHDGEVVAEHRHLKGRRGQYSTVFEHMPKNHQELDSPWSRERFEKWAGNIGPQTRATVTAMMDDHLIVEQSFTSVRNVLGLAKTYTPELLERGCARVNECSKTPSYNSVKNQVAALKTADERERSISGAKPKAEPAEEISDVADGDSVGRTNGASAYRRKRGGSKC